MKKSYLPHIVLGALLMVGALVAALVLLLGAGDLGVDSAPRDQAVVTTIRPAKDANGFTLVRASALPKEAQRTLSLIAKGGPYPYDRDGAVFENREGILPKKPSGYYREYTVDTPGSDDRGARRVIAGGVQERYYTDDHYETFVRVEGAT